MDKSATETGTFSGHWAWNDETQSMVFISCEKVDKKQEHLEKLQKNTVRPTQLEAFKTSIKQKACVTIQDVKLAAVCLLQEKERIPVPLRFLWLLKTKELDEFLANLLLYFSCYFQKKALEKRPKSLMVDSDSERQMTAEACVKVELAQKQLAIYYSRLLTGRGLSRPHHMGFDRIKVLSTTHCKTERFKFSFYCFCCYAAWVTFERRNLKSIQEKIVHLFQTDIFNPTVNTEMYESEEEAEDQESSQEEGHTERRTALTNRKSDWRPALSSITSPMRISLLPFPQEISPHLSGRFRPVKLPLTEHCDREALMKELKLQLKSLCFGILGKPLSQFSSKTLKPQKVQNERDIKDKEDEGNNNDVGNSVHTYCT